MKKLLAIILCALMLTALLPNGVRTASADDRYLEINETHFPDDNFRNWIIDNLDVSGDAETGYYMTEAQVAAVTVIECNDVAFFEGVEHFINLEELYCDPFTFSISGALTSVDLSANTKLKVVDLSCNPLESIDVTMLPDLEELSVGFTEITTLDVTQNTKLARLTINATGLTEIDLSKNPQLVWLDLCDAPIPKLDISGCPNMMAYYRAGERHLDLPYLEGKHVYGEGDEFVPYNLAFSDGTTVKTVTVHATAECDGTSVGDVIVSPEGIIFPGESFTLTAPYVEGYIFIGWYNDHTDYMFTETKVLTFATQEEEVFFVAKYFATSGKCGDNLYWSFDESTGTLTITGSGDMWDYVYETLPWADMCDSITSVILPDGLTGIGGYAFNGCRGLTSFAIPDSVTRIGKCAWLGCTGLTSITIPDGIQFISIGAFLDCRALKSVVIPDSVTSIGEGAFSNCTALTEIAIPDGVWGIGKNAFNGCTSLKQINLPKAVTTIRPGVFRGCTALKQITIPDGVTSIGIQAFYWCTGLTEITIPDAVTTIEGSAFESCSGLTSVTIGSGVEIIGSYAFYECTALTDVYYNGTRSDRANKLTIESENELLLNAHWHYLTEAVDGTVEWNSADVQFKGATAYVIANGKAQTPRFTVKNKADGSVIDPANYDYEYKENTKAGTGYVFVTFKGDYSGTCRGTFKIYLQPTTTTTVANISDGIKLTWSKVAGADGYVIYRRAWSSTTNGWTDFVRWNNTTALEWTDTKVYAGTRYQYGIKAYFNRRLDPVTNTYIGGNTGDNFNLGEVGPLKTTVRITTRTLNSVTAGTKQMTVKWGASSQFTGYQIQYATNSAFTQNANAIKIANPKTVSTVIKNLLSGKTYYIRIRSYHVFNGVTYFGGWSVTKSCKIK